MGLHIFLVILQCFSRCLGGFDAFGKKKTEKNAGITLNRHACFHHCRNGNL